jgi:hypothetical protein
MRRAGPGLTPGPAACQRRRPPLLAACGPGSPGPLSGPGPGPRSGPRLGRAGVGAAAAGLAGLVDCQGGGAAAGVLKKNPSHWPCKHGTMILNNTNVAEIKTKINDAVQPELIGRRSCSCIQPAAFRLQSNISECWKCNGLTLSI